MDASATLSVVSAPPSSSTTIVTTPPAPPGVAFVAQVGDSIGAGVGANGYAAIYHLASNIPFSVLNVSVSGRTLSEGYAASSSAIYPYRPSDAPSILLIELGTNDLASGLPADTLYNSVLVPFVRAAKTAGFYTVVDTLLPRSDAAWNPAKEQARLAYNEMVRLNTAESDGVNDLARDIQLGDSAGSNTSYYADGLHLTLLGQQRLSVVDLAAIRPFLSASPRAVS